MSEDWRKVRKSALYNGEPHLHCWIRPHVVECTGSHPNSEVKPRSVQLVVWWGTTCESCDVVSFCFFFWLFRAAHTSTSTQHHTSLFCCAAREQSCKACLFYLFLNHFSFVSGSATPRDCTPSRPHRLSCLHMHSKRVCRRFQLTGLPRAPRAPLRPR
jgi:hypothetical protein